MRYADYANEQQSERASNIKQKPSSTFREPPESHSKAVTDNREREQSANTDDGEARSIAKAAKQDRSIRVVLKSETRSNEAEYNCKARHNGKRIDVLEVLLL